MIVDKFERSLMNQKFFGNTFKPIRRPRDIIEIIGMSGPIVGIAAILVGIPFCLIMSILSLLAIPLALIVLPLIFLGYGIRELFKGEWLEGLCSFALSMIIPPIIAILLVVKSGLWILGAGAALVGGALDIAVSIVALPLQLITRTSATVVNTCFQFECCEESKDENKGTFCFS